MEHLKNQIVISRLAFRYGYVIERAFGEDTPFVLKAGFKVIVNS